jgi:hypothetical protein
MRPGELDRDTLQAHLSLQGWAPMYTVISKSVPGVMGTYNRATASIVITDGTRWFMVGQDDPDSVQTGMFINPPVPVPAAHEMYWEEFSQAQLQGLVNAMESYGVLHGQDRG